MAIGFGCLVVVSSGYKFRGFYSFSILSRLRTLIFGGAQDSAAGSSYGACLMVLCCLQPQGPHKYGLKTLIWAGLRGSGSVFRVLF